MNPLARPSSSRLSADHPVDLAWPAERAGEEDAQQVDEDRAEEQQRRPVVDLSHHEAGAHVEVTCSVDSYAADMLHARSGA